MSFREDVLTVYNAHACGEADYTPTDRDAYFAAMKRLLAQADASVGRQSLADRLRYRAGLAGWQAGSRATSLLRWAWETSIDLTARADSVASRYRPDQTGPAR